MSRLLPIATLALLAAVATQAGEVTFRLTDASHQPVADAVVSLMPLAAPAPPATPDPAAAPVEISQQGQEFRPYVTAIRAGTSVRFPNRDTVQHHVYSLSRAKKFEFPLYDPGRAESVIFDEAGIVTVGCNIHDWMIAYIVVLDTPWFARTPADGAATLAAIPPGRYRAEVWQPRLGKPVTRELDVADAPVALDFELTLKPDRRVHRTPQVHGRYN